MEKIEWHNKQTETERQKIKGVMERKMMIVRSRVSLTEKGRWWVWTEGVEAVFIVKACVLGVTHEPPFCLTDFFQLSPPFCL